MLNYKKANNKQAVDALILTDKGAISPNTRDKFISE